MKNKLTLQNIIKHIKTMFYNKVSGQFKKSQIDTISWWLKKRYNLIPMRELNRCEDMIISELVRWDKHLKKNPHNYYHINLPSLISKLCRIYHSSFEIDFTNNEPLIKLKVSSKFETDLLGKSNIFQRNFISLVHFIDYLKNEKLIYLTPNNNEIETNKSFIDQIDKTMSNDINDIEFINFVKSLYNYNILPTEYLIKYYENGYKTKEELHFEKNVILSKSEIDKARRTLYWTIGTICVAICIGVLTIYSSYDISNNSKITNDSLSLQQSKIERLEILKIDSLKKSNDNIQKELSDLNKTITEIIKHKTDK